MTQEELFGTDDQQAILRRGGAMLDVLGHDARFGYYGRTVGLITPEDGTLDQLCGLATVQGAANYAAVPKSDVPGLIADLTARGMIPTHFAKWAGSEQALVRARQVVDGHALPADLTMIRLDETSPGALLVSLADLALASGVLPLHGAVLRGVLHPSVCLVAVDGAGRVVSVAAASAFARPAHPQFGAQAWWGMLTTHPDRRGQKLALILGAYAMLDMQARFGIEDFMTGVEPGNAPSEAVCARLGLQIVDHDIVSAADPRTLASGRITK